MAPIAPMPAIEENVSGAKRSHDQSSRASSSPGGAASCGATGPERSSSSRRRRSASPLLTASRLSPAASSGDPDAAPTCTTDSPNTRCSSRAVRSTVRIRSRGTERRWRRSQPVCSSTRSGVIRYRVVRQRTIPASTTSPAAISAIHTRTGSPVPPVTSRITTSGSSRPRLPSGPTTNIRGSNRRHGVVSTTLSVSVTSHRPESPASSR